MARVLQEGAIVADRFRLERLLGQGAMGAVWLAHHTVLQTKCAVKFIHEDVARSGQARERFEREARAAARLNSPYVVRILDSGVCDGMPYIAMEHLVGEELEDRLKRLGRLPHAQAFRIISQVGRALTKAHRAGVVHRDLKPANIFLARDEDEEGQETAKVLDFGVAKQTHSDASMTKTGALLGTPSYMSPEQAVGKSSVDHRTDLWALAVIAFRLVVGRLPFQGTAMGDVLIKVVTSEIPVPSRLAQVPPGFDAWWARASQRDPDLRFQSAKELVDALRPILPGATSSWLDEDSVVAAAQSMSSSMPTMGLPVAAAGSSASTVIAEPAHPAHASGAMPSAAAGGTVSGVARTHAAMPTAPRRGSGRWLLGGGVVVLASLSIGGAIAFVGFGGAEHDGGVPQPPASAADEGRAGGSGASPEPSAEPPAKPSAGPSASAAPEQATSSSALPPAPAPEPPPTTRMPRPPAQPPAPPAQPPPDKPSRPAICDTDPYVYNSKGNLVPRPECL